MRSASLQHLTKNIYAKVTTMKEFYSSGRSLYFLRKILFTLCSNTLRNIPKSKHIKAFIFPHTAHTYLFTRTFLKVQHSLPAQPSYLKSISKGNTRKASQVRQLTIHISSGAHLVHHSVTLKFPQALFACYSSIIHSCGLPNYLLSKEELSSTDRLVLLGTHRRCYSIL